VDFEKETPALCYYSTDSGATWTAFGDAQLYWKSIALSADGQKVAAAVYSGQIYTSASFVSANGGAAEAAEFFFVGNGRFRLLNSLNAVTLH
jgi:hypothetical protein